MPQTTPSVDKTANWKTYSGNGLNFRYPPDWKVGSNKLSDNDKILVTSNDYQSECSEVCVTTAGMALFLIGKDKTDLTLDQIRTADQNSWGAFFTTEQKYQESFKKSPIKTIKIGSFEGIMQDSGDIGQGIYALTIINQQPYLFQMDYDYKELTSEQAQSMLMSTLATVQFNTP